MSGKLVVGLTGLPGSGKSVVVKIANEAGYGILIMGDIVRKEAERRGLQSSPENLGKIMLDLRLKEGPTVISRLCIPGIERSIQDKLLIDGVRSLEEAEKFREHYVNFSLIAIHSSPETRFRRLYRRHRSDDPEDLETFNQRDVRELGVGLGKTIAMAEYMIVNEGKIEHIRRRVREVLGRIEEKWMK